MILIVKSDGSSNDHKCIIYENLNRRLDERVINDEHSITDSIPYSEQSETMKGHSIYGYWFHITCVISFDHSMFYQNSFINGAFKYTQQHLPYEHLFNSLNDYNSVYYRPIFETIDITTLYLQGFRNFEFSYLFNICYFV